MVFDYIIEEMRPLATCEKAAFRNLIMGLTGITDVAHLPDNKVMKRELQLRYKSYVTMLTELISNQYFICITADIWSCNNKSYLGMTCHYINETNYNRCSYVLGCRRVKGSHTYLNIAHSIIEILKTFNIKNSKITHCVTDNASNFGKAFRTFSKQSQMTNVASKIPLEYFNESSSDIESELDDTNSNVDVVQLSNIFLNSNELINEYDDDIILPEHLTCASHTLSLIATCDVSKISDS